MRRGDDPRDAAEAGDRHVPAGDQARRQLRRTRTSTSASPTRADGHLAARAGERSDGDDRAEPGRALAYARDRPRVSRRRWLALGARCARGGALAQRSGVIREAAFAAARRRRGARSRSAATSSRRGAADRWPRLPRRRAEWRAERTAGGGRGAAGADAGGARARAEPDAGTRRRRRPKARCTSSRRGRRRSPRAGGGGRAAARGAGQGAAIDANLEHEYGPLHDEARRLAARESVER